MKSEKAILNETLVELTALPESLFYRNNTGQAWQGQQVRVRVGSQVTMQQGMIILANGHPVDFGLPGSGDIMGAFARRPVAVELKTEIGRQRDTQRYFQEAWERAGGLYVLARSADEARTAVLLG